MATSASDRNTSAPMRADVPAPPTTRIFIAARFRNLAAELKFLRSRVGEDFFSCSPARSHRGVGWYASPAGVMHFDALFFLTHCKISISHLGTPRSVVISDRDFLVQIHRICTTIGCLSHQSCTPRGLYILSGPDREARPVGKRRS